MKKKIKKLKKILFESYESILEYNDITKMYDSNFIDELNISPLLKKFLKSYLKEINKIN